MPGSLEEHEGGMAVTSPTSAQSLGPPETQGDAPQAPPAEGGSAETLMAVSY